jgi:hypothetical protein
MLRGLGSSLVQPANPPDDHQASCAIPSAALNGPSALLTARIPQTRTIALESSPPSFRRRRAIINTSRLVSFAAALVITATEWIAFSSLPLHTQSLRVVAAPIASAAPEETLPVIIVTAHRRS